MLTTLGSVHGGVVDIHADYETVLDIKVHVHMSTVVL
jgi:hypothetical protein